MPKPYTKGQEGGYAGLEDDGTLHRACCDFLWPVGSVYTSALPTSPSDLFGFGTWERCAVGRVIVGVDEEDPDFEDPQLTGGAKTVTLTEAQIPSHAHTTRIRGVGVIGTVGVSGALAASNADASDGDTATTGGGEAHTNLPPFETFYSWLRTG